MRDRHLSGCAPAFVLDDALVPPAGAPVQCCRRNRLFTATLPGSSWRTLGEQLGREVRLVEELSGR